MPSASSPTELDRRRSQRCYKDRHVIGRWSLRDMGGRPFPSEPTSDSRHIAPQRGLRLGHVDTQSPVDGLMADPQPEEEAPPGGIGNARRPLRADIGVPQVDVGNPGGHRDPGGGGSHQLHRGHHVVVDLRRTNGVESCLFGLARNRLDLMRTPAHARKHPQP